MIVFALFSTYHIFQASYRDPGFCIKHTDYVEKDKEAVIQRKQQAEDEKRRY